MSFNSFDLMMKFPLPSKHDENLINLFEYPEFIMTEEAVSKSLYLSQRLKQCKIDVYGDEGPIPHFHITCRPEGSDKTFYSAVSLTHNMYFKHGKYKGTLTNSEKKELHKFLFSKNSKLQNKTNYEVMCEIWNKDADRMFVLKNYDKIPNYKELDGDINDIKIKKE